MAHQTHTALMADAAADDAGQTTIRVLIKSPGEKVNICTGNGTSYSRITAVAPGTVLE